MNNVNRVFRSRLTPRHETAVVGRRRRRHLPRRKFLVGFVNITQLASLVAVAVGYTGNESVPIQLAQCRFPGLAISNAKILIYFFE